MKGRINPNRSVILVGLGLLIVARVLLRWVMAHSPFLAKAIMTKQ
jgi:hypothetical protein